MIEIDAIDRALLRALVEDAGQSAGALARVLGMSQPVIWRRIKRLRDTGVIKGTRLRLDKAALGFGVTVFLGIKLATKGRVSLDDFERAVTGIPEVQNVEHVLGLYDYRLRVVASKPAVSAWAHQQSPAAAWSRLTWFVLQKRSTSSSQHRPLTA